MIDQVCNAVRDDTRLPTACASEEQQRALYMRHSFTLLRVKTCEKIH